MAKDNNTGASMDEIDNILAGLEEDNGLDFEKDNTDDRDSVKSVAKNIRDGFLDSFKSNPKDRMINFIDNALPKSITREIDFIKSTAAEAASVYSKSADEIKSGVKSTVDIVKSKISQDSALHKMLNNISSKLEKDEISRNSGSNGPTNDEIITTTLTDLFSKNRKIDEITEKVKDIKDNKKFELNLLNNNKLISSVEKVYNFHQQYTLNYYKKSIELKLKTLFVNKELLEVTRTANEASIRQFEAIVKNTSLPDLTKLRNSEQFAETVKGRMRENMADMFLSAMRPLDVLKKGISDQIGETMEKVTSGLSMGLNTYEMASMSGGVASTAGGMAGDQLQNMVANMVSQKLEDMPFVKRALKKTKLFMADPSETFLDLADKAETKNTVFSRFGAKRLRDLAFMAQTKSVENKRFLEGHPDDVTLFDYKTKNSIVKIIPSILGKIYGEVKAIRTGDEPVKIYYDYSTGKLEESTTFGKRIEGKVKLALDTNVQGEINKFLSIVDKEGTMSESTNNNIMAALIDHLSRGGAISPSSLLKEDFLKKLDNDDRKAFSSKLSNIIDVNNNDVDAMTIGDLSDILYSVKTNTPHIDSLIKEFYTNGQIEEVEAMGLVDYDPVTGAYTVNKDKYAEIIKNVITNSKGNYNKTSGSSATIDISKEDIISNITNSAVYKNASFKIRKTRDRINKMMGKNSNYSNLPVLHSDSVVEETLKRRRGSKEISTDDVIYMGHDKKMINTLPVPYNNSLASSSSREVTLYGNNKALEKTTYLKLVLNSDKVDAELMHKAYLESGVHLSYVSLDEWAKSIGYKRGNGEYTRIPEDDTLNQAKKSVFDYLLGYFKSFSGMAGKITGINKLFGLEPNMSPLMIMHKVIKKTREWDTKIVNAIPKAIWKTVKGALSLGKSVAKGGFKGLFNGTTRDILRVIFNKEPLGKEGTLNKVHDAVKKTREWDSSFITGAPKAIWDTMRKGKKKWDDTGEIGLGSKLWKFTKVLWGEEPTENIKEKAENIKEKVKESFKENIADKFDIPDIVKNKVKELVALGKHEKAARILKRFGYSLDEFLDGNSVKENIKNKFEDSKDSLNKNENFNKFKNFFSDVSDNVKSKIPDDVKKRIQDALDNNNIDKAKELLDKYGLDFDSIKDKFNKGKEEVGKSSIFKSAYNNYKDFSKAIRDALDNSNLAKSFKKKDKSDEKVFGDHDNDGDRDNSWMDLLNKRKVTNKEEKLKAIGKKPSKGGLWGFLKDKLLWIGGLLATGLTKLGPLKHLLKLGPVLKLIASGLGGAIGGGISIAKTVGAGALVAGKALWNGGKSVASFMSGSMAAKTVSTSKAVTTVTSGATLVTKASGSSILNTLKTFKDDIIKKFGKKGGAKLLAILAGKIASRAIPIAGTAMLAYDAASIAADMFKNGTSLKSAISKQVLGFDLFDPDAVAKDEEGNIIKPDEQEGPVTENNEVDPNVDYYVRELLRIAKAELEFGVKDEESRAKLQEFKDKHKLKDDDIVKHYNTVKILELTKQKATKKTTEEELESLKIEIAKKVERTKAENEQGRIGSHEDSAYESGAGNGGAITQSLSEKAAQQRLENRDSALADSWSGYGDTTTTTTGTGNGNIVIKGKEDILKMLDEVSLKTGVDATLLKNFAAIESGFSTKIKSKTSSATGLFQFISDTWADMLKKYGAKYGLSMNAKREDPWANALMGAEYVKENKKALAKVGRGNSVTDLYLAHFLGPGGARSMFRSPTNGSVTAWADAKSLKANNTIFYKNGRAVTNAELYQWADNLVKTKLSKFGVNSNTTTTSDKPLVKDLTPEVKPPIEQSNNVEVSSPEVNKYTPSPEANNVAPTVTTAVDKASGFAPNTMKTTVNSPAPVVTTTNESYIDKGYESNVLKESLQVQIKMENHLRGIYEFMTGKKTPTVPTAPTDKDASKETYISMPDSVLDLEKKRF